MDDFHVEQTDRLIKRIEELTRDVEVLSDKLDEANRLNWGLKTKLFNLNKLFNPDDP